MHGSSAISEMLPFEWYDKLARVLHSPLLQEHFAFLEREYLEQVVYPPRDKLFAAFCATGYSDVKVLILGQDPYHNPGEANGLAFSVDRGVKIPPSLRNILKELHSDLGLPIPNHGYLMPWAEQGVLLLNSLLSVREGSPLSHSQRGWEALTDFVIACLATREMPMVFVLWGKYAEGKRSVIEAQHDAGQHLILSASHPSPLSARHSFFGSKPFSKINAFLLQTGQREIDWRL